MLPYKVIPDHFGFIQVHGLFEAIGFLVAILLLVRYVKNKWPEKVDNVYNLSLHVIIGNVVGARLAYVIGNFGLYKDNLLQVFNLLGGGLSYFGGLVGAVLAAYIYCRWKKLDFLEYADRFAVYIPLGHAIGRIGDYLIGEHIGSSTRMPWAVSYQGELRHPVPLYDLLFNLLLFFILIKLRKRNLKKGSLFAGYLIGYGLFRFLTGFIRVDEKSLNSLSIIQYFALGIAVIALIWMFIKRRQNESKS